MFFFHKRPKRHGSTEVFYEVSCDGKPYGAIWTWPNTRTEWHPWHSKPLDGEHETHDDLRAAMERMSGEPVTAWELGAYR